MTKEYTFDFIREAKNADTAIQIAHQDLLKTVPQAQLIEAAPDGLLASKQMLAANPALHV